MFAFYYNYISIRDAACRIAAGYASGSRHIHHALPRQIAAAAAGIHHGSGMHHGKGKVFSTAGYGAFFFPVLNHRAEIAVLVQPAVETRRGFCPAGGGEKDKGRSRQQRQHDADDAHSQRHCAQQPEKWTGNHGCSLWNGQPCGMPSASQPLLPIFSSSSMLRPKMASASGNACAALAMLSSRMRWRVG